MFRLVLCALLVLAGTAAAEEVSVPWRPGNAQNFREGWPEEGGVRAAEGALPVTILRPDGASRAPFVLLLHGCGGLRERAMWTHWVEPWARLLRAEGIGTAVVDSFTPRGVEQVCRYNVAAWAVRRADDAYSVGAWLAQQPYVDPGRIAVLGMSNGGRTVLAALRAPLRHSQPFIAGMALYPGCQSDGASRFYAPLLVLAGRSDSVTPVVACERMRDAQPAGAPDLRLIVYAYAPHTFDMALRDRTVLGMRLGYDAEADADARRQVVAFLAAHGLARPR